MKATPPTTDSKHQGKHAAVVTCTQRPDGSACYSIEVSAASQAVIQ